MKTQTTLFGNRSVATLRNPMRYFVYARKSTDDDRQALSLPDQVKEDQLLAERRNLEVIEVVEEARSAQKPNNRPKFNQMLTRIEKGEADGIIAWKVNRLSRNMTDGGRLADALSHNKVKHIVTVNDGEFFPHTPIMLLTSYFSIGAQYSKDLGVDTARGLKSRAETGQYPSKAKLGYLNDFNPATQAKYISRDPERFKKVAKLWQLLLTGKYTLIELWYKAQEINLTNRKGQLISKHGLECIFNSEFYCGYFYWNKKRYKGSFTPMITEKEFKMAQSILLKKRNLPKTEPIPFTYRGLIRCGVCGASVIAERHIKPSGRTYIYYRCCRYNYTDCGQRMVPEPVISSQVGTLLSRYGTISAMKSGGTQFKLLDGKLYRFDRTGGAPYGSLLNNILSRFRLRRGVNEL